MRTYLAAFLAAFVCASASAQAPAPNVIYVMTDDLGPGEYAAYDNLQGLGQTSKIDTPNINALAAGGMRFNNAHAATSLCAPTRAVIMAGAPTWQTSTRWGFGAASLQSGQQSVGDLMQAGGYRTALMGKGHLGGDIYQVGSDSIAGKDISNLANMDFDRPLSDGMLNHGYDYTFNMIAGIQARPYLFYENDLPTDTDADGFSTRITNDNKFDMIRQWDEFYDDGVTEIWEDASGFGSVNWKTRDVPQAMLNKAVDFMEESVTAYSDQPFFLHYNSVAGHWPYVAPPSVQVDLNGDGDTSDAGEFYNVDGYNGAGPAPDDIGTESMQMVSVSDAEIGVLMSYLEQTDDPRNPGAKLIDNTMIVYTSDNGGIGPDYTNQNGPLDRDEWEVYEHDSTGGLRDNKASSREGGHRVPLIVQWPEQIEAGAVRDQRVSNIDLMGTLAGLTGQSLIDQGEGSFNLMPVLVGDRDDSDPIRDNTVVEDTGGASDGNVSRKLYYEDNWKLNLGTSSSSPTIYEVFDLNADPGESNNLVGSSDPEVQARISSMYASYLDERNAARMAPVFIGDQSAAEVREVQAYGDVTVEGELAGPGRVSGDLDVNGGIVRVRGEGGTVTETFELVVSQDIRLDDDGDQYNDGSRISIGRDQDLGLQRSAISFDLTQIALPTDAVVQDVEIEMTVGFSWGPAANLSPTIEVYPLTTAFDEAAATWDVARDGVLWTTAGGDYDDQVLLATGDGFDPGSVGGGQTLVIDGQALAADVLANLTDTDYDLLLKYDDVTEQLSVASAMWIDSLQLGSSPTRLVIYYETTVGERRLTVAGDYTQRAGATLELALGGSEEAGASYDQFEVEGDIVLKGGDLVITLDTDYTPALGDDFDLLSFSSLTGEFDSVVLADLPLGLMWDDSALLSAGTLSVIAGVEGDYNDDGVVNAADYVVWRENYGAPAGSLPNDGDGGEIGMAQYDTWLANFGLSEAELLAAYSARVPEPTALGLVAAMTGVIATRRSRDRC